MIAEISSLVQRIDNRTHLYNVSFEVGVSTVHLSEKPNPVNRGDFLMKEKDGKMGKPYAR